MAPLDPLPALLLIITLADFTVCQRPVFLGYQEFPRCTIPNQVILPTFPAGTNFSITCSPECASASLASQQLGTKTVFGTSVYNLDSDLCLAAVHDARLPHPNRMTGPVTVQLKLVNYGRPFVASFRRQVTTGGGHTAQQGLALRFISDRVNEVVPDITTVHTNFRRSTPGNVYVRCHVGSPDSLSDIRIHELNGEEATLKKPENKDGFVTVTKYHSYDDTPDVFLCHLNEYAYSGVTTFAFSGNAYYEPGRRTYRTSVGEAVTMEAHNRRWNAPTWFRAGFRGFPPQGNGERSWRLEIPYASEEDAGIYLVAYDNEYRPQSSATRLIVRDCPAGYFGAICEKRCPHCLHGGQCHEVTGQCICPPGFFGPLCEKGCGEARFGSSCSETCPKTDCIGRLLCVPDPYGCSCAPGLGGYGCNQECGPSEYGPDCAFQCGHCQQNRCNRFTGHCSNGCTREDVRMPLCQESEWPWFRDPPTVIETGFTHIAIRHPRWRRGYDNGYSNGTLRYIGQIKPADGAGRGWSTLQPAPAVRDDTPGPNGKEFQFTFSGLNIETRYLVRIIIEDVELRAQQDSDNVVPTQQTSTDCDAPGEVGAITTVSLTARSVSISVGDISNKKEVCPVQLNVTLTAQFADTTRPSSQVISPHTYSRADFSKLRPFFSYTVTVFATNRKGSSAPKSQNFRTPEAAPSEVTSLKSLRLSRGPFSITWNKPVTPNGVIRHYEIHIQHSSYIGCTSSRASDSQDTIRFNSTEREVEAPLKHHFSEYRVTVTAFTVAPGTPASITIATRRHAPKEMVLVSTTPYRRSAYLSWAWPRCSTWGDDRSKLRLDVTVRGSDRWNKGYLMEKTLYGPQAITELIPYSNYSFEVYFCNTAGCHPTPQDIELQTPESEPAAPANVTVVGVSPTSLTVGWDPPWPPLSRIAQYTVRWGGVYTSVTRAASEVCAPDTTARPRCRIRVTGLSKNAEYSITVYATNHQRITGDYSEAIRNKTGEAAPGPPKSLSITNRSQTTLNISWLEPGEKNGYIRGFRLNVSLAEPGPGRRRRETAAASRIFDIAARPRTGRRLDGETPYTQLVEGLSPGRRYRVQVAANTSAGFGKSSDIYTHTLVAPPVLRDAPSVRPERTTDSTVLLVLPRAENAGGPVSSYLVVVSTDPDFDGAQLQPHQVPNVEESEESHLDYYITAVLGKDQVELDNTFVVGDGQYYNSTETAYLNRPLTTGASYRLGVAALSRITDDNQQLAFRPIGSAIIVRQPPASPVVPVVLVFLVLFLIVAAVAAIYYRKRIKKALFPNGGQHAAADVALKDLPVQEGGLNQNHVENEDLEDDDVIYANVQPDQINYSRIELTNLVERTKAAVESDELKVQLQSLPHGLTKSCTIAKLPENRRKNRYINLLPYDDSRVVLQKLSGDDFSDYINANYIGGYNRPRAYIACQGPKTETVSDFWRMVWQEKVTRIVMLTNLVESGKRKCHQYWPDSERLRVPGMTVINNTEHVSGDFTVRKLSIKKGEETRAVTHFHYTAWPDHGVPMYLASLTKFVKTLNEVNDGGAPTVVHCSAGVGRTGTVILIDSMYQMGLREHAVDVYSHLAVIRQQRANLCANVAQYRLVHYMLIELLVSPSAMVPAAQVAGRLKQLRAPDADGTSQLQLQLRYLEERQPTSNYASLRGLKLDGKNRSSQVLPEDASRVFLDPRMPDNYINAVYVQGYKVQDAFIATEAPLPARKYMFWQMVIQKHSRIVVVMNDLEEEDIFWPAEGQTDVFRDVEVQSKGELVADNVTTISLKISHFGADQATATVDVNVLVLTDGDRGASGGGRSSHLPTAPALLQLYSAYMRSTAPLGHLPAVVVCRNGVDGCGLFLATCFELEHLSEEQELDVMLAVSTVRRSRAQFITGLDQFELCYDVAVSWLDAFATYANFQ